MRIRAPATGIASGLHKRGPKCTQETYMRPELTTPSNERAVVFQWVLMRKVHVFVTAFPAVSATFTETFTSPSG